MTKREFLTTKKIFKPEIVLTRVTKIFEPI